MFLSNFIIFPYIFIEDIQKKQEIISFKYISDQTFYWKMDTPHTYTDLYQVKRFHTEKTNNDITIVILHGNKIINVLFVKIEYNCICDLYFTDWTWYTVTFLMTKAIMSNSTVGKLIFCSL